MKNHCSFLRRLSAIFYDCLLLTAVLFVGTFVLIASTSGEAIDSNNIIFQLFLLFLAYAYFCWHWVTGGQTLGMRSWHVFVVNASEQKPSWKQASVRFVSSLLSLSICGLGFIWALFDKRKLALHDHLSKTKLIVNKN